MAAEKSPAFSYYPKDLLSDDRAMAMSGEAFGCYWWLVSVCWLRQYLPDDAAECAALVKSKVTSRRFAVLWPEIRACFEPTTDGRLLHRRLDKERAKQSESRERRSAAARKRWDAERESGYALHQRDDSNADAKQCLPSPSSSPTAVSTDTHTPNAREPLDPHVAAMPRTTHAPGPGRRGRFAFEWRAGVPEVLHAELLRKLGGSEDVADLNLRAWYRETADLWGPDKPIGDDDFAFWRARFVEWQGTTRTSAWAPKPTPPRITDTLRQQARDLRSKAFGGCPHDPKCSTYAACVEAIAASLVAPTPAAELETRPDACVAGTD